MKTKPIVASDIIKIIDKFNPNKSVCHDNVGNYIINPKRAGGGRNPPPFDIFCYISAGCYFFALKLFDFFSLSLALDLKPFL